MFLQDACEDRTYHLVKSERHNVYLKFSRKVSARRVCVFRSLTRSLYQLTFSPKAKFQFQRVEH